MKFLITGRPGVGKTTLFMNVVNFLRGRGVKIGGFMCPEVRAGGRRVGFKIVALDTNEEGWLARKQAIVPGPRVGSYTVVAEDAIRVGVSALDRALKAADLVCIDEIGPMELAVRGLRDAIINVLASEVNLLAVIHWKLRLRDPYVYDLAVRRSKTYEVTEANRNALRAVVATDVLRVVRRHGAGGGERRGGKSTSA